MMIRINNMYVCVNIFAWAAFLTRAHTLWGQSISNQCSIKMKERAGVSSYLHSQGQTDAGLHWTLHVPNRGLCVRRNYLKMFQVWFGQFNLCHTLTHGWRASPWIGRPIAFVVNRVCTLLRALGILLDTVYSNLIRITLLWPETLPVLCLSINLNLLEKWKIWSRVSYL